MALTAAHLYSLVITLALVTLVGLAAACKVKSNTDFTVGGRSSGASLIAGTIIGTIIGGASTIGTAQLAFAVGLSAWWFTLGAGIALLVLALFYAKPLRASGLQTIPQYLVMNYGPVAGPITSITSSIGIFFSIVANILSATPLLVAIFGFSAFQAAAAVFFLIVVYVFFGGVWGTGLVGILKAVLIYVTLLAAGLITYREMGGFSGFMAAFPYQPWFNLFGRGLWIDVASGLSLLVGTLSTQTYIQAVYSAKDVRTARNGAVLAALITLPTGIPAVMVGLFMRAHHPEIAAIDALPLFIVNYLPPWLGGVAIATLLLAAVGSAAGLALGVGTMLSGDLVALWLHKFKGSPVLWITRLAVLLTTLLATLFTFGNLNSLILQWNFLSMGLRGAGIFLPLSAAVFFPGLVAAREAIWSMAAGAGVALVWKLIFPEGIDPLYAGMAVSGLFLVYGWLGRRKMGRDKRRP
ncbi:MAG: sodium:solute symporter family protein [Negativicutes bacterium]|nr:sodium:solute symporter family protein [Negativicutes bacterium]